jgi:hypothetical protein
LAAVNNWIDGLTLTPLPNRPQPAYQGNVINILFAARYSTQEKELESPVTRGAVSVGEKKKEKFRVKQLSSRLGVKKMIGV